MRIKSNVKEMYDLIQRQTIHTPVEIRFILNCEILLYF